MTRSTRFRPTRAGIVNLWDYRDQEFSFADGRLVLRGPNGSGKTKALEVLYPFVLDGRIEPRRLNPFAGEERTMKSNLLYRGQDSAHSYVWMEFGRGRADDPECVTVGIGMRATRSVDRVTRWYFVVDGRVGVDFSLLGDDDRPLTKKQLAEQIGTDAIVDRPIDYRAAIDARMFGLGAERYDQLITLILTLRRPQLAKNLDPKGLSRALSDGLRPLDEHLVLDAARSFSDMEEVGRALEGIAEADRAAASFLGVYGRYLSVQARTDVDQVQRRLDAVDHAVTALFAARALQERRRAEREAAERRFDEADRALDRALTDQQTLQRSSAYEGKQQLDDLADAVRRLEISTQQQAEKAVRAQEAVDGRRRDAEAAAERAREVAAVIARAEDELTAAAEDAGIAWTALPADARVDRITAAVRGHAEERDADVRAVRAAVLQVDRATAERTRAERAVERGRDDRDRALAAVRDAEATVAAARARCAGELRSWWTEASRVVDDPGVPEVLADALDATGDDDAPSLRDALRERTRDLTDALRAADRDAARDAADARRRLAEVEADRARVAAEHDDAPPVPHTRGPRASGTPLWQLVRFADGVDDAVAAGIEAALEAAGVLDALVAEDGAVDVVGDTALTALDPVDGPSLADVLVVEDHPAVSAEAVRRVLTSVALGGDGSVRVSADGTFALGVLLGSHTKSAAEYIGATARARRRAARAAELDAEIGEIRSVIEAAERAGTDARVRLDAVHRSVDRLPGTTAVTAALRSTVEAAGALRSRTAAAEAAERDLDAAVAAQSAAEKALRTAAVTHRAPHLGRELDALAAAIRHFENTGHALLRHRGDVERAAEREREAAARLEEAVGNAEEYAEEAAIAETGYEQQSAKLEVLRESLGADADQIEAELAVVRRRIEECKKEQTAARKAATAAGEDTGAADGALRAASAELTAAITETLGDARRLAPYAERDLLAVLGAPACSWPTSESAWSTPDQVLYRMEAATHPDDVPDVLPPEVRALLDALVAATADVKATDSARKTTRGALTAALQDFDAGLASSGQDFRLEWDAVDGVTVVRVQDERGRSTVADFAARVAEARRDQESLLTDAERRILEDALLTGLAQQIHDRTVDARALIARMGAEMKERRMSSGSTIGVHWVLADTLDEEGRAVSKLLERDSAGLAPEDLARIRAYFAARIRSARAAHPERSYPEILTEALDYRQWRVFAFTLLGADGSEDRLTVARHSALSGGEQSVSLHLPLFAAAHVMLSSADPHSPRLLALDEAFAGVDDNGRRELLGLSVQFDLDLFMTGYDLWITYAGVPGCAHYDLAHSTAENTVSAALLVWDDGELLAEHDGSDLAAALGSPQRRRVPTPVSGGLDFAEV
ncbi:TIGR02680 family protein [Rhodococcoides corynebacterioides]|uniref:TIGR02680 family protein n=1 Tax=Rhodococcoides corynebacterioides TaxID=53972 RepID=A0ABS7P167_9NOCA|nr:TIGR02680 family protein [Rhodococcus corynebacterioides]MBY6366145.1 TIGR02680 family protein [Rhodococcus corynebacterioides]MBY6406897.1 TIGR02680 family protein [Rhodococcus corynebacterioides]